MKLSHSLESLSDQERINKHDIKDSKLGRRGKYVPIEDVGETFDETDEERFDRILAEEKNDPQDPDVHHNYDFDEAQIQPHPKELDDRGYHGKHDPNFTQTWHRPEDYHVKEDLDDREKKALHQNKDDDVVYSTKKKKAA